MILVRDTASTGARGEAIVATHLESLGFEVLARNVRVGRLELDLIAVRNSLLVFCEVRSRTNDKFMDPIESIDRRKIQNIRRAAAIWLREQSFRASELRFDAASVIFDRDPPRLVYYEDAF